MLYARTHIHASKNPRESERDVVRESEYRFEKEKRITYESVPTIPLSIGLLRAVPFILFLSTSLGKTTVIFSPKGRGLCIPSSFPSPFLCPLFPCPPASPLCSSSQSSSPLHGTSPLEAVAPSRSARSPNLPTDPHDFASGIMVPAPKLEHARHEAPTNLF